MVHCGLWSLFVSLYCAFCVFVCFGCLSVCLFFDISYIPDICARVFLVRVTLVCNMFLLECLTGCRVFPCLSFTSFAVQVFSVVFVCLKHTYRMGSCKCRRTIIVVSD